MTMSQNGGAHLLEADGISKYYGNVVALNDVSAHASAGEVTCILGDNGAGKSTMLKIAAGVVQPDDGQILIGGERARFLSPLDARAAGIETVYQDLAIAETRSCTANVFVGREITRAGPLGLLGVLDRRTMHARTAREWALRTLHDEAAVAKHFVAVSTNAAQVADFEARHAESGTFLAFWFRRPQQIDSDHSFSKLLRAKPTATANWPAFCSTNSAPAPSAGASTL